MPGENLVPDPAALDTGPIDAEAVAGAIGALLDSLLLHLRDRRLLEDHDVDDIYEAAIGAHLCRQADPLSARIALVLTRMQSDGTALRRAR